MKQANHENILPFYGVSTDISNFCLVFPWYKNGNIMDYIKENTDANRYDLVSASEPVAYWPLIRNWIREQLLGAISGLRFLHGNGLAHGALRPVRRTSLPSIDIQHHEQDHILVDDRNNARLAMVGYSSIVPTASVGGQVRTAHDGSFDVSRYSAPEIQWPEDYGEANFIITKESDVYGLAMVTYEARSY